MGIDIRSEVNITDSLVLRLDQNEKVYIRFNDEVKRLGNETLTLVLITSITSLYETLSLYGPGVISLEEYETESYQLTITAVKIAEISGEILLTIKGFDQRIAFFLESMLLKMSNDSSYFLKTLVPTHMNLDYFDSNNISYQLENKPFPLIPGQLLKMSSNDPTDLILELLLLPTDINSSKAPLKNPSFRLERTVLSEIDQNQKPTLPIDRHLEVQTQISHEVSRDHSFSIENDKTCSLVELNKREVTYLIGKNGWKISAIRSKSGAHVKVVPIDKTLRFKDPNSTQFIRVTGDQSEVKLALNLISLEIQHFRVNEIIHY